MLQLFFDKRPWFAPKRYGFGAGLPIAWQGWALILSYISLLSGAALLAESSAAGPRSVAIGVVTAGTAIFVAIVHRRTDGGWRWRWG